jgi:hypothetical protein
MASRTAIGNGSRLRGTRIGEPSAQNERSTDLLTVTAWAAVWILVYVTWVGLTSAASGHFFRGSENEVTTATGLAGEVRRSPELWRCYSFCMSELRDIDLPAAWERRILAVMVPVGATIIAYAWSILPSKAEPDLSMVVAWLLGVFLIAFASPPWMENNRHYSVQRRVLSGILGIGVANAIGMLSARGPSAAGRLDRHSDYFFQVTTSEPPSLQVSSTCVVGFPNARSASAIKAWVPAQFRRRGAEGAKVPALLLSSRCEGRAIWLVSRPGRAAACGNAGFPARSALSD